jgi:hypothetical protein
LYLKNRFGKNSANTSTMMVDMIVCIKTIKQLTGYFQGLFLGKFRWKEWVPWQG